MKKYYKWKGYIIDVDEYDFTINVCDVINPDKPDSILTFEKTYVRELDQKYIEEGSIVSVYVRFYDDPKLKGHSLIKFFKFFWTKRDLDYAKREAKKYRRIWGI